MRSNTLIINSKFKPFSYLEMLHPVLMADTAHKELETGLGELQLKAGVWDNLLDPNRDLRAYEMYSEYARNLWEEAAQLAAQGLTPGSRQNLNSMREQYGRNIVPIESAYNTRKELAAQQLLEWNKDLTIRFDRRAAESSLDDYINNPMLGYRAVSGNVLAGQVAVAAENLRRDIAENPTKYSTILDGQYIEAIRRNGFTAEEVDAAIKGMEGANPILRLAVDNVMQSAGLDTFSEPSVQELRHMASQGLYKAIGDVQHQYLDPWKTKMDYQDRLQLARDKRQHKRQKELMEMRPGSGKTSSGGGDGNWRMLNRPTINSHLSGEAKGDVLPVQADEHGALYNEKTLSLRERLAKSRADREAAIRQIEESSGDIQFQGALPTSVSSGIEYTIELLNILSGKDVSYTLETSEHKLERIRAINAHYDKEDAALRQELGKEYKEFNRVKLTYGELVPGDEAASITMGLLLEKSQAKTQHQRIVARHNNTAEENKNVISTIRAAKKSDPNIGFKKLNEKTNTFSDKIISREKENELFMGSDMKGSDRMFTVLDTEHGELYVDAVTGDKYKFQGEQHVDNQRRRFTTAYQVSRDFTLNSTKGAQTIDYDNTLGILEREGALGNYVRNNGVDHGNDVKSLVVKDARSGDIIKMTVIGNSEPIVSSLYDETFDNGRLRNSKFQAWMNAAEDERQRIFQTPKQLELSGATIQGTVYDSYDYGYN